MPVTCVISDGGRAAYDVCGRKGRFLEGEPHTVRTIVDGPVTDYFVGWGAVAGMAPTIANGGR